MVLILHRTTYTWDLMHENNLISSKDTGRTTSSKHACLFAVGGISRSEGTVECNPSFLHPVGF